MIGPQLRLVREGKGEPESMVPPGEVFAELTGKPWWEEKPPQVEQVGPDSRRERGMKKIAILTDFFSIDPAYSLTNVAGNQIKMLLRHGYDPLVLVDEYFPEQSDVPFPWNSVRLFKLPSIPRSNRAELPKDWEKHLDRMTEAMREGLKDTDVVITHDLIYQPAQILYNGAARQVDKERDGSLRWIHVIHSATTPALINTQDVYLKTVALKFPHSVIGFPNSMSRARVARNFGYEEDEIKTLPHSNDFCEYFGFQEITTKLVDAKGMLGAEVIMVYPARLDRGKQLEWVLSIGAELKNIGRSVRIIFPNFHSTGQEKKNYQRDLENQSRRLGLSEEEVTFLSDFDETLRVRCPREMIRDLFILSNVFVLPSRSETFSLIALEAGLSGNLIILNHDFPPLRFWGEEALYYQFSSNIDKMTGYDGETSVSYHPSRESYAKNIAHRITYELQHNRGLAMKTKLRRKYSLDHIFREYLEPLLYA